MNDQLHAGVDEVGRGPLAGAVVVAAVILDPFDRIDGLRDSKVLSRKRREALDLEIRARALAWSIARADVEEIDQINILQATMLAMTRAVAGLKIVPDEVLVDGNRLPDLSIPARAIIKGDDTVDAIMAASIIAKVSRDSEMEGLDALYPEYGLARHKGYATRYHLDALRRHGPCPVHRKSFAPCRQQELFPD